MEIQPLEFVQFQFGPTGISTAENFVEMWLCCVKHAQKKYCHLNKLNPDVKLPISKYIMQ